MSQDIYIYKERLMCNNITPGPMDVVTRERNVKQIWGIISEVIPPQKTKAFDRA